MSDGMLKVNIETKLARVIVTNAITFSNSGLKIKISRDQISTEQKFYENLFKLKLVLGSIIRGHPDPKYVIEHNCPSERDFINIIHMAARYCN